MLQAIWFIPGLIGLTVGAELLVRGASGLARALGLPALVIGLTVVAYGTSAPELAVSIQAALNGKADLALGNVVGSNSFNILFILGLSATILPLVVAARLIRMDVPLMIGVSGLTWALAADGSIGRAEGLVLALLLVVYTVLLIVLGKREQPTTVTPASATTASAPTDRAQDKPPRLWVCALLVLGGLGLLVLGSRWFVYAATELAVAMGVSDLLIGLTIVAAGTSMPEVATSVMAALRGQRDIAVGNVIGSNLFNLMGVLGVSAAISSEGVGVNPAALRFDLPIMVGVALVCLPIFFTGGRISRLEGALLLLYYAAYVAALALAATGHPALGSFNTAMIGFVFPLTALGLAVSLWQHRRAHRRGGRLGL